MEVFTLVDPLSVVFALLTICVVYCFQLKRGLDRMTLLRETERKGRTSAERALRSGLQEKAKHEGFNANEIGHMKTPFCDRRGTPRQGTVCPSSVGTLVLNRTVPPASMDELEKFSHVWVIFIFHDNTDSARKVIDSNDENIKLKKKQQQGSSTFVAKVTPPRLGRKVGVFSTRSPHRPNPIGLTVCSILNVDSKNRKILLGGVDFVDGTPVLDIKPYVPYDSIPDCVVPSWVTPPDEHDLTSGKQVDISQEAKLSLSHIFSNEISSSSKSVSSSSSSKQLLEHYKGKRDMFESCIRQVIAQDPRSLILKNQSDSTSCPFHLTIDGVDITFIVEENKMAIINVAIAM